MAQDSDEPLDPKVEAIRRKLVRLLAVSGGIMALGLAAVVIAIVYRVQAGGDNAGGDATVSRTVPLVLPAGAEILATAIGSDRLAVTLRRSDGSREILVVDTQGRTLITYELR